MNSDLLGKTYRTQEVANPANYYVNVHTGEYPDGAIRGQLANVHDHMEPMDDMAPMTTVAG